MDQSGRWRDGPLRGERLGRYDEGAAAVDALLADLELWVAEHARPHVFVHAGCAVLAGSRASPIGGTLTGRPAAGSSRGPARHAMCRAGSPSIAVREGERPCIRRTLTPPYRRGPPDAGPAAPGSGRWAGCACMAPPRSSTRRVSTRQAQPPSTRRFGPPRCPRSAPRAGCGASPLRCWAWTSKCGMTKCAPLTHQVRRLFVAAAWAAAELASRQSVSLTRSNHTTPVTPAPLR